MNRYLPIHLYLRKRDPGLQGNPTVEAEVVLDGVYEAKGHPFRQEHLQGQYEAGWNCGMDRNVTWDWE